MLFIWKNILRSFLPKEKFLDKIKSWSKQHQVPILGVIAFIICFLSLKEFFLGRIPLCYADAIIYQEQALYYAHHLSQGTFPLWNDQWSIGTDNVFFLQRIGAFNPFYSILALALKLGITPSASYLIFLTIYHLVSLIGFYLVAKEILQDKKLAFFAFLLALFSSLTLNLFVTYTHLLFCPLVWFFYFLIRFSKKPSLLYLCGITLSTSTLITTYIPFYFIITFLLFIFFWAIFYGYQSKEKIKQSLRFIKKYWIFTTLCALIIGISLTPGITLKKEGEADNFILESRQKHTDNNPQKTLVVQSRDIKQFDALAELRLNKQFGNFKNAHPRFNFIPISLFLIILLTLLTPIRRQGLFLLFWGLSLVAVSSANLNPDLYYKMFDSIIFFRYIRMMHFFLFFAIIPILILLALHQLKNFIALKTENKTKQILLFLYLIIIHLLFTAFVIQRHADILSIFITIAGSFIFFCLYFFKNKKNIIFLFALIILIQPVESFYHIQKNAHKLFSKEEPQRNFKHALVRETIPFSDYYTHKLPSILKKNIPADAFEEYTQHAFIVYDAVEEISEKTFPWKKIELAFKNHLNLAYVTKTNQAKNILTNDDFSKLKNSMALYIAQDIPEFKILRWTPTHIVLETNFPNKKFIVFNDPMHPKWLGRINHKPAPILTSNVAFKGLWVPAGKNIVEFKFGSNLTRLLWGTAFLSHYVLLLLIILLFIKQKKEEKSEFTI